MSGQAGLVRFATAPRALLSPLSFNAMQCHSIPFNSIQFGFKAFGSSRPALCPNTHTHTYIIYIYVRVYVSLSLLVLLLTLLPTVAKALSPCPPERIPLPRHRGFFRAIDKGKQRGVEDARPVMRGRAEPLNSGCKAR